MGKSSQRHILIFEPRIKGHHLSWLRYVTEDFLNAGFRITWAADYRPEIKKEIQKQLSDLMSHVSVISLFDDTGKLRGGSKIKALADCFCQSGADEVFLNNFDEIASNCLRYAAVGIYPPQILQGCLSGIYFRPRFLANRFYPLGNIIKATGFRRLFQQGWFKHLYLTDEYLFAKYKESYHTLFCFLPDVWAGDFSHSRKEARKALKIPLDKFVFLSYGIGDRRKGLHLVVRAMQDLPYDSRLFLLCAGQQIGKDREVSAKIEMFRERDQAKLINRYVSDTEEELCFCASDVVLLPYIRHFGSSGVLSRAAAAGKMIIASDEELISKRVAEHNLGWLFSSGNAEALQKIMNKAALLTESDMARFQKASLKYARSCSREAFRTALLMPYAHD